MQWLRRWRFRPRHSGLFLALVSLVPWGLGCRPQLSWERVLQQVREDFPQVEQLSTADLAAWLADDSRLAPVLLDVREADEFAVSHLPGAVRISPDAAASEIPAELLGGRPIVAYCSVGYRSSRLLGRLRAGDHGLGEVEVYNLEGSIFRWANEGRPVVRAGEEVQEVHPFDARWGELLDPERRDSSTNRP